jgi:hypothetical protein
VMVVGPMRSEEVDDDLDVSIGVCDGEAAP